MLRQPGRSVLCRALPLLLVCTGALAVDDQQRVAREMIQALDAYAVYKMGQFDEAYTRFRSLAEAGNRQGMLNLANMLAAGQGVERNPGEALAWYRRAAEAGDPIGMYEVGKAYDLGLGVPASRDQALEWYRRAAENDSADAQWALGKHLHDSGETMAGLQWIRTAASEGEHPGARQFLASLAGEQRITSQPEPADRQAVLATLAAADAAVQRRDGQAVVAAIDAQARISVRLPDSQVWTGMSRDQLAALWQATFDRVDGYRYARASTELLAAEGGVLAFSLIHETLEKDGESEALELHETAQLRVADGQAVIRSLRLDIRRSEE